MGKATDWEEWSEKFLARTKRKGNKQLLVGTEKIAKLSEFAEAEGNSGAEHEKVTKAGGKRKKKLKMLFWASTTQQRRGYLKSCSEFM